MSNTTKKLKEVMPLTPPLKKTTMEGIYSPYYSAVNKFTEYADKATAKAEIQTTRPAHHRPYLQDDGRITEVLARVASPNCSVVPQRG